MRYSEIDLQCEDIMWFGIDLNGHILAFTSGGCGCVPEYVCQSKEETEKLEEFFLKKLSVSTECKLETESDDSPLIEDARLLSQKGIFVYDVSIEDGHENEYSLISRPSLPRVIDELPEEINKLLNSHIIEGYTAGVKSLQVKHAY